MNSNFDAIANGIQTVLTYLADKPDAFWYAIGVTLGSAIVASTVLEYLTRRYARKWDIKMGRKLIATLLGFLSFLSSSADALITNAPFFATPILQRFAWIVTLAIAWHHFIGNRIAQQVVAQAAKWSEAKSAPIIKEAPAASTERQPIPPVSADIWSKN